MNTKALRQKILDLAIHGKLVPQDPNDEPASVLLERIKAEKERLIKEGKIKRTKRSKAACDKPHYPYELPKGWCFCCINDIAESLLGKTLDKSKDKGVPKEYLCAINVQWGRFDFSILKSFLIGENEFQRYSVKQGDLMVCEGGDVGRCAIWEENEREMYYQNALHRIRCEYGISNYFLQYALWYYKLNGTIDYLCKGVTIKHFTQTTMSKLAIPLPPSNEQKRIVDEIQRLFSIIDKVEERKDKLQLTIRQTKSKILDLAIHGKLVPQDPTDEPATELLKRINPKAEITCDNPHYRNLPKGWAAAPMQMLCSLVDGEKQSGVERINLDVKFLRGEREAKALSAGKYVAANTLLILVDGENSGEVFRTPIEGYQGSTFKQLAIRDNMNTDYVLQVINLHRKTLRENKVGSAIPHLNKKLFKAIEVPIPPYEEQQRIVNAINEAFTTIDAIAKNL